LLWLQQKTNTLRRQKTKQKTPTQQKTRERMEQAIHRISPLTLLVKQANANENNKIPFHSLNWQFLRQLISAPLESEKKAL
jgi:hypothetical protein